MTAIIILNWNNANDTISCLDSLVNAKGDFRVYLVDNGSVDNSLSQLEYWVKNHQEIDVVLIPLDKNYGFASGNNKGIAIASKDNPDSYLLLNNDTEVTPDFLTNLKAFQAKNPKYKVLTPLIYFHGCKSKIWNAGGRLKFGKRKYYYSNQSASAIKEQEYIPITFVTGCALFFKPEILDENKQIFTERFFFGEEDIEFSMRMKKIHTGMACVLDSVIYHKVSSSISPLSLPGKLYIYYLNRFVNIRIHYGLFFFYIWRLLSLCAVVKGVLKNGCPRVYVKGYVKQLYKESLKKDRVSYDDFVSALERGWSGKPRGAKRIMILSDSSSDHTKRWVKATAERGHTVALFSLNDSDLDYYQKIDGVKIYAHSIFGNLKDQKTNGTIEKLNYLKPLLNLKRSIKEFKPDVVHAHYATSYGLLGVLSGFHPLIISLWGSDAYLFPKVSFLHRKLLEFNFSKADRILSTSHCMAREVSQYTNKNIIVTPFGVDTDRFSPFDGEKQGKELIIGTVKSLSAIYGLDTLIDAFDIVVRENPELKVQLVIAGDGTERKNLEAQVERLGLTDKVTFLGRIPNTEVAELLSRMDVYVALSRSNSESFGVAAVEAMSCGVPVVVSDADGFMEVVPNENAGYIVPRNDAGAAAEKISYLLNNHEAAVEMGNNGRLHVLNNYMWENSVDTMMDVYKMTI